MTEEKLKKAWAEELRERLRLKRRNAQVKRKPKRKPKDEPQDKPTVEQVKKKLSGHKMHSAELERRAVRRKAEAEFLESRNGQRGGYVFRGSGLSKAEKEERRQSQRDAAKQVVPTTPRERPNRYVPLDDREAAEFLSYNGWEPIYLNDGGLWCRAHWVRKAKPGEMAYYSTRKAIKVQRGITANCSQ